MRPVSAPSAGQRGFVEPLPVALILDARAVRLNGPAVAEVKATIALVLPTNRTCSS